MSKLAPDWATNGFRLTDEGELGEILFCKSERNETAGTIHIKQTGLIGKISATVGLRTISKDSHCRQT